MNTLGSGTSSKASSTSSASPTPPGIPAPYGRACANCVKAKCKCFYRGSGRELTSCERCHRLGKDCVPSETVRKRRQTISRTAQLEEKLDDLVSLLKTHQQKPGVGLSVAGTTDLPTRASPPSKNDLSHLQAQQAQPLAALTPAAPAPTGSIGGYEKSSFSAHLPNIPSKTSSNESPGTLDSPSSIPRAPSLRLDQEAQECLDLFTARYLYYFPFFHVAEHLTAYQLQLERPLFMLAIKAVTCKVLSRQIQYSEQLQQTLAQKAVVKYENSIDMLLALITCIGWIHFHEARRPFMTVMTRLATSQVIELGLHRPVGDIYAVNACKILRAFPASEPARPMPTNEQRRAALGCYFITSSAFTSMKRAEGLPWTAHLEGMMTDLANESEWRGDKVLVAHVKLQQIQEQLYRIRFQPGNQPFDLPIDDDLSKGLPSYYISLLKRTAREVGLSLSADIATDVPVQLFQRYVDVIIAESALNPKEAPFLKAAPDKQNTEPTSSRQLENIHELVEALERLFDCFYEIPPIHFIGMSYAFGVVVPHAMWTLLRLCMTQPDSVWNPSELRQRMDVLYIVDQLREKLLAIPELVGLVPNVSTPESMDPTAPPSSDIFTKCGPMLESLRLGWGAELQKCPSMRPSTPTTQESGRSTTFNGDMMPVTQQESVSAQMNSAAGFGSQCHHQDLVPLYMPQYDVSSWLSFPPMEQNWLPMDISYN